MADVPQSYFPSAPPAFNPEVGPSTTMVDSNDSSARPSCINRLLGLTACVALLALTIFTSYYCISEGLWTLNTAFSLSEGALGVALIGVGGVSGLISLSMAFFTINKARKPREGFTLDDMKQQALICVIAPLVAVPLLAIALL